MRQKYRARGAASVCRRSMHIAWDAPNPCGNHCRQPGSVQSSEENSFLSGKCRWKYQCSLSARIVLEAIVYNRTILFHCQIEHSVWQRYSTEAAEILIFTMTF